MFNCEHPDAQIQAQALIIKEISPRNRLDFIFVTRSMKQGSLDSVSYHQEYRGRFKAGVVYLPPVPFYPQSSYSRLRPHVAAVVVNDWPGL